MNGVSEQYFRVKGYEIADGIAFSTDDVKQQAQVAVIDQNTRKKFFANGRPHRQGSLYRLTPLPGYRRNQGEGRPHGEQLEP